MGSLSPSRSESILRLNGGFMQAIRDKNNKSKVIVRAWGDEPVVLFLYATDNKRFIVSNERGNHIIGIPAEQVFAFDEDIFSQLSQAYNGGDWNKLASIYETLSKENTCNRYQITLNSQHDKEHFTNSCSVASGRKQ
jgi:hypothetical protein